MKSEINLEELYNNDGEFDYDAVKTVAAGVGSGEFTIRRLNPGEEQGRNSGGRRNVEATIICGADARTNQTDARGRGQTRKEKLKTNARVEALLEKFARHEGLWLDHQTFIRQHEYLASGQESHVYQEPNSNFVLKAVDYDYGRHGISPLEFIDNRISLFNYIFPETKYQLTGFTRDDEDRFRFILRQPFIIGEAVHPRRRTAFMKLVLGANSESLTPQQYVNSDYHIWDLHLKNLLQDHNGIVFVIDALLELNTPERYLGGLRNYEEFGIAPGKRPSAENLPEADSE